MRRLFLLPYLLLLHPAWTRAQLPAAEAPPAGGTVSGGAVGSPVQASPAEATQPATNLPAPAAEAVAQAPQGGPSTAGPGGGAPEAAPKAGASGPLKVSYSSCTVEGQYVALTFDDGPHAQHTPRLLDILKQRGVKATFFVVGQNAAEYPQILKRIAAEGHELANHSYTHPVLNPLGEGGIREQLDKTHQAVLSATGVQMKLLRPPYGALTENLRRWALASFGYRTILWDVDPLDWKVRDAGHVQSQIVSHTRPGSIILTHDIHKSTVDAMPGTLDQLLEKGYKFVTVSELLAMDRPAAPKAAPAAPAAKATSATSATGAGNKATASKASSAKGSGGGTATNNVSVALKTSAPASAASKSASSSPASGGAAKKSAPLTKEELRKKWLELNKR